MVAHFARVAVLLAWSCSGAAEGRYDTRFLGETSKLIATARACATRIDPWFVDDPWASYFVGGEDAVSEKLRALRGNEASLGRLAIRTRYFDGVVAEFCERHEESQVVLLGAGLDTRAQRLYLGPGCAVFALDTKRVVAGKLACAAVRRAPLRCKSLEHVVCDLTDPAWTAALESAPGFRRDVPTIYVAEGLLYYLEEADVAQIVSSVAALAAPKSKLLASLISSGALANAKGRNKVFSAFRWGVDDPLAFLRRHGCRGGTCRELGRRGLDLWWRRHPPRSKTDPAVVRPPSRFAAKAARTFYVTANVGDRRGPADSAATAAVDVTWDEAAEEKLANVPFFVRGYVRRKTEEYAAARGLAVVTCDVLADAKRHHGR